MHEEGDRPSSGVGGSLPAGVLLAIKPLLELAAIEKAGAAGPAELAQVTRRTQRLTLLLLDFYVHMTRGMTEFRRVYGLPGVEEPWAETSGEAARRVLSPDSGEAALARLEAGIQELKVHHAALLEAYHEATHRGTREILDALDPETIRREFRGAAIQVGPLKLPVAWKPVLMQAIWEEMLVRMRRLRGLEAADYEKFFREGFRDGYRKFWDSRRKRDGAVDVPAAGGAAAE